MSAEEKGRAYIEIARQEFHQYAQGLLRENEKLRAIVAMLESEKRRIADALLSEKTNVQVEASKAQQERDQALGELDRLRARFQEIEQENYRYLEQYHQIEQHSSNLSNLYVASYQLHASVDRQLVLNTIQEIVINLIGSEEVAIFEADGNGRFQLASSFGLDAFGLPAFALGEGPIGSHLASGEIFADNYASAGNDNRLTACVPLKIDGSIIGAIAVFRLLPHKMALERVDHELFELLAVHAATSLYCSSLHSRAAAPSAVVA